MIRLSVVTLILACGCAPSEQQYFPLSKGNRWSYAIKSDFETIVDDIVITGRVPVGERDGFELHGKFGTTRLAWNGPVLVASQILNQRFDPPIPILGPDGTEWNGTSEITGRKVTSHARLASKKTKERFAGREYEALQIDLALKSQGQTIELTTWFVKGIGILKQEQRTGDRRDRRIEYLSGPEARPGS